MSPAGVKAEATLERDCPAGSPARNLFGLIGRGEWNQTQKAPPVAEIETKIVPPAGDHLGSLGGFQVARWKLPFYVPLIGSMTHNSIDPSDLHLAFISTRLPHSSTFQLRDLHALLSLGVKVDLYLYDLRTLDPGLREAIERNGGAAEQIRIQAGRSVIRAFLSALCTNPGQILRDVALGVATLAVSPAEGLRALAILPASIELGSRIRASHVHALWAGVPATTAFWIARRGDRTFSFSGHAWDLLQQHRLLARKVGASSKVVVCSAFALRTATARVGPILAKRIQVVHHGLDLESWPDRGPTPRPSRLHVIAIGRLVPKKGFDYLLEASQLLRQRGLDVTVEIIGPDGGMGTSLKADIQRRNLASRVSLTGPLSSPRIRERLAAADVLCCPSVETQSHSDGIPNVVLEAMSSGTPVVTTDAGGLAEVVIPGETGRITRQRDPMALADELAACWRDWEATQRMCRNARACIDAQFEVRSKALEFLTALQTSPVPQEDLASAV